MSEHLKKVAGNRSQIVLYHLTNHPIKAVAIGSGITALIQSSSAVCAIVVGLVDSHLIELKKAITIILGSILGTAVTGWLIAYSSLEPAFGITKLLSARVISACFAIIGIFLKLFFKSSTLKRIGEILLGFSILMLGISTITATVEPLKSDLKDILRLGRLNNEVFLLICGLLLAALLQSASAAVGIVQTISISGVITLQTAFFLLLGIGIGASLPVLISAIGKSSDAKRAAFSYLCTNVIGAVCFSVIVLIVSHFGASVLQTTIMTPITIALLNTTYRFILVLALLPLMNQLVGFTRKIFKVNKRGANGKNKQTEYN